VAKLGKHVLEKDCDKHLVFDNQYASPGIRHATPPRDDMPTLSTLFLGRAISVRKSCQSPLKRSHSLSRRERGVVTGLLPADCSNSPTMHYSMSRGNLALLKIENYQIYCNGFCGGWNKSGAAPHNLFKVEGFGACSADR
jgi:hypothetical protein